MKSKQFHGLLPSDFQRIFGVSRRTALRWFGHGTRPEIIALAHLIALADLGILAPEWRGWRIVDGELFDPLHSSTRGYRPAELRAMPYLYASLAHYRAVERLQRADGRSATSTLARTARGSKSAYGGRASESATSLTENPRRHREDYTP